MSNRDEVISRLIAQVERLSARVVKLEMEADRLRAENQSLRDEIARLKKNSSNSSKPPSSDIVKPGKPPSSRPSNGKPGGQPGHAKYERMSFPPEQIHGTRTYKLSKQDAAGLKPLNDWHGLEVGWIETVAFFARAWQGFVGFFARTWQNVKTAARKTWNWIKSLFDESFDLAAANQLVEAERDKAIAGTEDRQRREQARIEAEQVRRISVTGTFNIPSAGPIAT